MKSFNQKFMNYPSRQFAVCLMFLPVFLCFQCQSYSNAADPRITIIEPQNGAVVRPGESVLFRVEVDPTLLPGSVVLAGRNTAEKPINSKILTGPPYEGSIDIPPATSGSLKVMVGVSNPQDGIVAFTETNLMIIPSEAPVRIEPTSSIRLAEGAPNASMDQQIRVEGTYVGEITRDVSGPALGTSYRSLTPTIISVNSSGYITPVSRGYGYVLVENQGASGFTQVIVEGAGGTPPPMDQTGSVAIRSSGFRRDPQSGSYVQQVSIKNTGTIPLPKAIRLVISNLPEGVTLQNSSGKTRLVEPVGAVSAAIDVEADNFLSPGETATATLKFSNREGAPITYSMRLYCGGSRL